MEKNNKETTVDITYELAVQSYDQLVQRLDEMHKLLGLLLSVCVSLLLANPLTAKALDITPHPAWFALIFSVFCLSVVFCFRGRMRHTFKFIDLGQVHQRHLSLEQQEFKRQAIRWAASHQDSNADIIEDKWKIARIVIGLICLQSILTAAWIVEQVFRPIC